MNIKFLLPWLVIILIQACAVPIVEIPPPTAVPEKFTQSGTSTVQEHWWLAFNDPQLNRLIDQALNNNFSLLSTFNRLQQAEAIAIKQSADLIPSIGASFGGAQSYSNLGDSSRFALGLNASYEVDLWGRLRAQKHAAELERGVAIFAKACFGHPSPSKRQKLNATAMPSAPRFVLVTTSRPNRGSEHWLQMT